MFAKYKKQGVAYIDTYVHRTKNLPLNELGNQLFSVEI